MAATRRLMWTVRLALRRPFTVPALRLAILHVTAGDILAVIESPETRDDGLSGQSNGEYTPRTPQRLNGLSKYGVVSMLDRDNAVNAEKRADADLQRARNVFDYT
jgi:hypothetical protein